MSSINFDNPWLLFLALPLVLLFAVPFFVAVRKDNANGHNIASGIIHIIMALIIAFVAAGTSVVTTVTQTDVYVLADVSYSADRNLDAVDGYIRDLSRNLPDHSRMGVICFAEDCKLVTRLGERFRTVKNSGVENSSTDIIGALDYTGKLFREDVIKRIVLITDGKQTNSTDENALKRQVDALIEKKIHVDAIYLDDNISADEREVQLSSVQVTQTACINRTERAGVTVNVNCPEFTSVNGENVPYELNAVLTLYKDGEKYADEPATLTKGANTVFFTLPTDVAGTFEYDVEITCDDGADTNDKNNSISFTQTVSADFKVLLISGNTDNGNDADYAQFREIYGDSAQIDAPNYLGSQVPFTVEELCVYDEIVLSDLDVRKLAHYEEFLKSLDTVVSLFGKSLVTFGNTYIQGDTDGELRGLDDMLPVRFGSNDEDPKLFTFVIDTSLSMFQLSNLDRAKRAAKEVVALLSDDDEVAIVEFNGDVSTVRPAVKLADFRDEVVKNIDDLGVKQGTNIQIGLERSYEIALQSENSEKRVMLFSDGLDSKVGDGVNNLLDDMVRRGIGVSVLDVGRGSNNTAEASDAKQRLNAIAVRGNGSYLDISTDDNLEEVINNELPKVNETEGGFSSIIVRRRVDDVLNMGGMKPEDLADGQYLEGFYFAREKGGSTTVLSASMNNRPAPLYSYWNYGNGRVSTFTTTMCGEWVQHVRSENLTKLYSNIMETGVPAEKVDYPFNLTVEAQDGYSIITLTPETMRLSARATVEITSPDGSVQTVNMTSTASDFTLNLVTPEEGKYSLKINYAYTSEFGGGFEYEASRTVSLSYSSEYDSFALYDAAVLHKAIGANGKVSEDGKLKIENDLSEVGLYNLSLNLPLLIACVVLYAIDIAVRKLKWEDIRSFFKRNKKAKNNGDKHEKV